MKRKIALAVAATGTAVAMLPLFAAFEAHVINVTARIENALAVSTSHIDFGTVFPQEHLDQPLLVQLSQSFLDEDRVDDVDYIIRQKPKCGITTNGGQNLDESSTQTGHVFVGTAPSADPRYTQFEGYYVDCGEPERTVQQGETYGLLPMLCPYISKHPDGVNDVQEQLANDGILHSFHSPFAVVDGKIQWNDTRGHLAKAQKDTKDNWTIDLAVPCFGNYCAQDWADFVHGINPDADPTQYTQDIKDEHKVFGCDLWIEVTGISLPGLGCKGKIDLMLVVDRSGSIGATDMATVRTALKSFVDALVLAIDGPHAGQSSFASLGTLDQELTSDPDLVKAAIDTLVSSGATNLTAGINEAKLELESIRDRGDAPDFMVIVTDGQPNVGSDPAAEALAAANAAKAAGIEIYVVGVGGSVDATYLKTIASGDDHYFAGDFATLNTTLADIVSCEEED